MYTLHSTKNLLDRIKSFATVLDSVSGITLGNWFAKALRRELQFALLVNEKTLQPVLMPLVPMTDLATRFPEHLANVLAAHFVPHQFIDHGLA
jgi:hypothetical protein